jgi:membrane protein insertase Oxa1/YidC/SpoIIIJ
VLLLYLKAVEGRIYTRRGSLINLDARSSEEIEYEEHVLIASEIRWWGNVFSVIFMLCLFMRLFFGKLFFKIFFCLFDIRKVGQ